MMTNVVDCDFDALEIGMPLDVVFRDIADDVTIPVFRPPSATRGSGDDVELRVDRQWDP